MLRIKTPFILSAWGKSPRDQKESPIHIQDRPRNCIGKGFAMQEMRLAIATLVKHYDFEPIPQELKDAKDKRQFITLQVAKNSFKIRIKRRD